jgi:hypothetical protein
MMVIFALTLGLHVNSVRRCYLLFVMEVQPAVTYSAVGVQNVA